MTPRTPKWPIRTLVGFSTWFLLLSTAGGCSSEPEPCGAPGASVEVSLIDHEKWVKVPLADDPYASELPDEVTCGVGGHEIEGGAMEIDTGICNFVTLKQPTIAPAKRCDELRLVFWHLPLYAGKEGAQAYASVRIGDLDLLDERIEIGPQGVVEKNYIPKMQLDKAISAGTDVYLHIHNHGLNTWKLLSITVTR